MCYGDCGLRCSDVNTARKVTDIGGKSMRVKKINVDIAQYLIRQAFEEGFRYADSERGQSKSNPEKGKWFDAWVISQTRAMLVANGVIDKEVGYK